MSRAMDFDAPSLLGKLTLASVLFLAARSLVPIPLQALGLVQKTVNRAFPGSAKKARLARLRHQYTSPPMRADDVSDAVLLGNAFDLVEARKIDAARRMARKLRSRGCKDTRLAELEAAIVKGERRARRKMG